MKKIIFAVIFFMLISSVFAQDNKFYYHNVSIEKIYATNTGYLIFYRTHTGIEIIGVPYRWFNDSAGMADIVRLPGGTNWPTMTVFYKEGEFSNLRLYVHRNKAHITWGSVPQGTDVSSHFPEDNTFRLKF